MPPAHHNRFHTLHAQSSRGAGREGVYLDQVIIQVTLDKVVHEQYTKRDHSGEVEFPVHAFQQVLAAVRGDLLDIDNAAGLNLQACCLAVYAAHNDCRTDILRFLRNTQGRFKQDPCRWLVVRYSVRPRVFTRGSRRASPLRFPATT